MSLSVYTHVLFHCSFSGQLNCYDTLQLQFPSFFFRILMSLRNWYFFMLLGIPFHFALIPIAIDVVITVIVSLTSYHICLLPLNNIREWFFFIITFRSFSLVGASLHFYVQARMPWESFLLFCWLFILYQYSFISMRKHTFNRYKVY